MIDEKRNGNIKIYILLSDNRKIYMNTINCIRNKVI